MKIEVDVKKIAKILVDDHDWKSDEEYWDDWTNSLMEALTDCDIENIVHSEVERLLKLREKRLQ